MRKLPDHSSRIICGQGHNPYRIEVAPSRLTFGNVITNRTSTVHQLVVTNIGPCPVNIGDLRVAGSFRATTDKKGWLNPGQHFIIDVVFAPRSEGIHQGSVYVETDGAAGTEYAALLGYGYAAGTDPGGGGDDSGEEEGGIIPKFFSWIGDGIQTSFPLSGADAFNKYLFDTSQEKVAGTSEFFAVNPATYSIDPPVGAAPATIRFLTPPPDGALGFTVLRGYSKPYAGDPPLTTTSPEVMPADPLVPIDGTNRNSLIIVSDSNSVTLNIRRNTGDVEKDWKAGDYFSVVQHGTGSVTLAIGAGGTLFPPSEFQPKTRGQDATISATCINPDADQWLLSGDLLRGATSTERHLITLSDRTRLLDSSHVVNAAAVDSIVMPFGFKFDAVVDGGLTASLAAAQASGNIFTVDILKNGVSVLQSKLTINNGSTTSVGATTPASFIAGGDTFAKGDLMSIVITSAGVGPRGMKVYAMGMRQ